MFKNFVLLNLLLILSFLHTTVYGKTITNLRIKPENVGVFYQNQTQQFQAIAIFDDGSEADYTNKVGWSIAANPFKDQTLTPTQVATIDDNGLATVKNTWGRIYVVATYPKPLPITLAGIYGILLKTELVCDKNNLDLCLNKNTCETAGGFWWNRDRLCHSQREPLSFLPAIYLILFK